MYKNNFGYLIVIILSFVVSCKQKTDNDFNCTTSEISLIGITGNLTLDSKGNPLVDFIDTTYNGKIKIANKEFYESIYMNYDAFLSIKNIEESEFKVSIYGHYVSPIDTTNWLNDRRDFYVHQMSFGD